MIDHDFIEFQHALAGEYSLERELGRGGMGIVYLAREVQLNRLVAIKLLPPALAGRADVRERFLREARMAASLSHPHVVPIYRVCEAKGFVFFVMAYVDGETLGERLRTRGPLSAAAASRMLREVAWALSYAHGRGIVHRDIKPDNILVERDTGRALVSDFGIALGAGDTVITDPNRVMGSAHFMSPEQASSAPLDGRSDLYSLGIVAYLAISGRLPFNASNVPAILAKHANADVPALAETAPTVPRGLSAVIERCLRKSPSERFATGEELAEALEAASSPVRAKLPLALRVWTQARDPLIPFYLYVGSASSLVMLRGLFHSGPPSLVPILAADLLAITVAAVYNGRKTFNALSAGYTVRDLRAALAIWQQERREELSFELDEKEPRWAIGVRGVTYAAVTSGVVASVLVNPFSIVQLTATAGIFATAVVGVLTSNALGVRLIGRTARLELVGAVRSRIWNSRAGEWVAKLLTPKKRKAMADLDYRPTEMALGLAVGELFAALPKPFRDQLSDLPAVVERLEAHAAEARARVDELAALMAVGGSSAGATGPANLAAARDAARADLGASVAALESVRLDLLRLHAGGADMRPITTALDAARELGQELDRLNEAQREVNDPRARLPLDITPPTPA